MVKQAIIYVKCCADPFRLFGRIFYCVRLISVCKVKVVKYTDILTCHTAMGTHMPYTITQCYLPLDRGDIPAFTPAEAGTRLSDPGGMQSLFIHVFCATIYDGEIRLYIKSKVVAFRFRIVELAPHYEYSVVGGGESRVSDVADSVADTDARNNRLV